MNKTSITTLVAASVLTLSSNVSATPVNLSSWAAETIGGSSNWTLQAGNNAVLQTVNGTPTFFYEAGTNAQGKSLSGKVKVATYGDDDYIGFALGLDNGEIGSASADFMLIDWKQDDQSRSADYGKGKRGLAISHVTNASSKYPFWGHDSSSHAGVHELQRGATRFDSGWNDLAEYAFELIFTSSLIEVYVNNTLEISLTAADAGLAAFDDGAFGFYNYSQSYVLYSAIEEDVAPSTTSSRVTEPSSFIFMALGLLGLGLRAAIPAVSESPMK